MVHTKGVVLNINSIWANKSTCQTFSRDQFPMSMWLIKDPPLQATWMIRVYMGFLCKWHRYSTLNFNPMIFNLEWVPRILQLTFHAIQFQSQRRSLTTRASNQISILIRNPLKQVALTNRISNSTLKKLKEEKIREPLSW